MAIDILKVSTTPPPPHRNSDNSTWNYIIADCLMQFNKRGGPIIGIYKSLRHMHVCGNWD